MASYAEAVLRPVVGSLHNFVPDLRCEAMCRVLLRSESASVKDKSLASSLLAGLEPARSAEQRRRYLFAVDVCGGDSRAVDYIALARLPELLIEGLGGPADPGRGEALARLGCERGIGPCLELEARRQRRLGDRIAEAELWQRAAASGMPNAMAIVHGSTCADALRLLPATTAAQLCAQRVGELAAAFGDGGFASGQALRLRKAGMPLYPACAPTCDACGRRGAYQDSGGGGGFSSGSGGGSGVPESCSVHAPPPVLSACGGCKRAAYCSLSCQMAAWPGHRAVCHRAPGTIVRKPVP